MARIGTIGIESDNTMSVVTGNVNDRWVPYSSLVKLFLASTAAREAMNMPLDSPEVLSLAARIMARAQKRK